MMEKTKTKTGISKTAPVLIRNGAKLAYVAAALAFASQLSYLWVLQEEFLFRPLSGGLMFLVAILQGILVVGLLFGPGRWMLRFGIALNALLIVVWVVTRLAGSPGLLGFDGLPVEPLNVVALISEAGVVILLSMILRNVSYSRTEEGR